MDPELNVLAIAPEEDWKHLTSLHSISGLSLLTSTDILQEQLSKSQLIILSATNGAIIKQWLSQIRRQSDVCLLPVMAVTAENHADSHHILADAVIDFPVSPAQLEPRIKQLTELSRQIKAFSPLVEQFTPHEGQQVNLLRYLSSRKIDVLTPTRSLNSKLGYAYPLAAAFLDTSPGEEFARLAELAHGGLLQGGGYDRLHLCPDCKHYQLNFREVCPQCQLPHIKREGNIHHYACSYIAPESEFIKTHQLTCPKCKKPLRHIGVDYDKPSTSYKCLQCRHLFPEAVVNCLCINCGNIFSPPQAQIFEVKEYRLTLAGMRAAETGMIREVSPHMTASTPSEILNHTTFEELFRVQHWISKRLQRPLCLIGITVKQAGNGSPIGGRLRQNLRGNDLICQLNEAQFVILSLETDREKAELAMQRISKQLTGQLNKSLQLKIGITQLPQAEENLEQLMAGVLRPE